MEQSFAINDSQYLIYLIEHTSFLSNHDNKDITISPKASARIYWIFDKVEMPPKTLRLYGTDYSLKDI